ncbi:alpha/beta hydrolase [Rhodovulum sp. 12E13]|nr:alpha/beta hydrolase [Rhodovulum sp. 12E13]
MPHAPVPAGAARRHLRRRRARPALFAALLALCAAAPATAQERGQGAAPERGVPYVTLRDRTGAAAPADFYGEARSDPKAGWCGIDERRIDMLAPMAEAAPFHVPDEILRVSEVRERPRAAILEELRAGAGDRAPLLYTHGFYIDFDKGCRRATIFQENAGLAGRMLWFSWPSDGALLNYTRDEADLYWSVPDLADTITALAAAFADREVDLAGHSLGARGVVLALYEIAARQPDLRLGELVLLAPDMDFDIFRKMLPRIRPMVRGITVYVADADRPLALSTQLHGYPRLGETGNDVATLGDVDVIDVSALPVRSPSGHLYHIHDRQVGADLRQLLDAGRRAADRDGLVARGRNLWALRPAR